MQGRALSVTVLLGVIVGCSSVSDPALETDAPLALKVPELTARADATIAAVDYCESVGDFFCDFYLRCGRMAASDVAECRAVFAETCNARYESRYVDLERAELLSLSKSGVEACAAHLATVSCSEQPTDLDGPCASMWVGAAPVGAKCGIDVESLVCAQGTTCIVGMDFCGTCEAAAPRGGACQPGVVWCGSQDACIDGICAPRSLPGQACGARQPCVLGASCVGGTCVAPSIVTVGEACDSAHRCPYRSFCDAGVCKRSSLLGEACSSARACASGRCEDGTCLPLRAAGEVCRTHAECRSAQCVAGTCTPLPSACLEP